MLTNLLTCIGFFRKNVYFLCLFTFIILCCSNCKNNSNGTSGNTSSQSTGSATTTNSTTTSAAARVVSFLSPSLGICPPEYIQDLDFVVTEKMGASGNSPGEFINFTSLKKFKVINNWEPYNGFKSCFCGEFDRYNGYEFLNERDWNFMVNPNTQYYKDMFALTEQFRPLEKKNGFYKEWNRNGANEYLLEGEITPSIKAGTQWFKLPFDESEQQPSVANSKQKICMYGPWVSEYLHNYRPEIHPMELFWFRDKNDNNNLYLNVVHDASSRFADKDFYVGDKSSPWKPWSQSPINGTFKLPFRIAINSGEVIEYTFDVKENEHWTSPPNAALGPEHIMQLDGLTRIRVMEPTQYTTAFDIDFVDVCKVSNDSIQGYVQISLKVGTPDDEGIFVMKVNQKSSSSSSLLANNALKKIERSSKTALMVQDVRTQLQQGKRLVLVDYFIDTGKISLADVQKINSELKQLNPQNDSIAVRQEGNKLVFKNIPAQDKKVQAILDKNAFQRPPVQTLEFMLTVIPEKTTYSTTDVLAENANIFKKINGIPNDVNLPIKAYKMIEFKVKPYYCPSKRGECEYEEDNEEYRNELNKWLAEKNINPQKVRIDWSFQGLEIVNNKQTSVNGPNSNIRVTPRRESVENDALTITFNNVPNSLFRLIATATVSDDVNKSTKEFIFDNYATDTKAFTTLDNSRLLEETIKSMGLNYDSLFQQRRKTWVGGKLLYKPGSKERIDMRELRYHMLFNYYQQMPLDGVITAKEIQVLRNAIRQTQPRQ